MKEQIDLTIKPTMNCNISCKHCFNGDTFRDNEKLDINLAIVLMEKACLEYRKVKVIFHGGEPTLVGMKFYSEFYKRQQELQDQYGTVFENHFTTNGILLTNDFIDLLHLNNVLINISFDGPFNDILRQRTEKVKEVIFNVRDKGCRIRCFCTITKESVLHLPEIYEWFKGNRLDFKTLPIEKRGFAKNANNLIMTPEILASKFEEMYHIWIYDKDCNISYSTMEEFTTLKRDRPYKKEWFGRKITLHPNGQLFTFGRPNDIHYCIGNPSDINKISDCFETESYKAFLKRLETIRSSRCPKCFSKTICGGLNINISYLYEDDLELIDYSCRQSTLIDKRIIKINDEIVKKIANGEGSEFNDFVKKAFGYYQHDAY